MKNSDKERTKQVFAKVFGIKKGDWVKKKYHGRKTWVIANIYSVREKEYAQCWRKRRTSKYRYPFYESVRERILLSNLILIEDKRNPEYIEVPRS